jgi:hypothetical protein
MVVRRRQGLWEELDMGLVVAPVDREVVKMVAIALDRLEDMLGADQRD